MMFVFFLKHVIAGFTSYLTHSLGSTVGSTLHTVRKGVPVY